MSGEEYKICNS